MKKIETLEDLVAERNRLNLVAKQMEDRIQEDFQYFSNRIQPIFSIFDGSSSSSKMSSLLLKGATTILPLLLSKRKSPTTTASPSPWVALGTTALGLLAGGQANGLIGKVGEFFQSLGKKKKNKKRRRHRLCRCTK